MNSDTNNRTDAAAQKIVNKGFLFGNLHPETAYMQAMQKIDEQEDKPFGIKKAMRAAVKYNYALNAPQNVAEEEKQKYEDEYLRAIELLKNPHKAHQQTQKRILDQQTVKEEIVIELLEAELATLLAEEDTLPLMQRVQHLFSLTKNWHNNRHSIFSDLLVKIKKAFKSGQDATVWIRAADAILEKPFFNKPGDYADASYNAYLKSREALNQAAEAEAHLFTVLKAAIDYNQALFLPIENSLDPQELKIEYETLRDTLLFT